jgi:hypothetical protein
MTEDNVDPENPRPSGHYLRFCNNEWHYVPDELAQRSHSVRRATVEKVKTGC